MSGFLENFLASGQFMPHGHCYLWKPELMWLHFISDSLIALTYFSIPIMVLAFARKQKDLRFDPILPLSGAVMAACGTTHLMEAWTLWYPTYWLSISIKAATAVISLYTASELVPFVSRAFTSTSSAQLETANQTPQKPMAEHLLTAALHRVDDAPKMQVTKRTQEPGASKILQLATPKRQQTMEELSESVQRYRFLMESQLYGLLKAQAKLEAQSVRN